MSFYNGNSDEFSIKEPKTTTTQKTKKPKLSDAIEIQRNMLILAATWPDSASTVFYKIRGYFVTFLAGSLIVMILHQVYNERNDFFKLSETLYYLMMATTGSLKMFTISTQRENFAKLINFLEEPIFAIYPDECDFLMVNRIKYCRFLSNAYRILVFSCVFMIVITPLTNDKSLIFPLAYNLGWYKFAVYAFQASALFSNAWNNCCLDALTACLMSMAATQLDVLAIKIAGFQVGQPRKWDGNEKEKLMRDDVVVEILKHCIRHHLAIIEYIELIEKIFSFVVLSQFISSAIVICNALFHFVLAPVNSVEFLFLFIFTMTGVSQIFMYCWFGNEIIWKSHYLSEACYSCEWYKYGNEVRRYLFLMMERSKRPLKITAYKFSIVSLSSFTTIMRWSYSYLALLFNFYRKQH